MVTPVDLYDEPELRACEVDDEVSDDELAAEGEAELRAGESSPECMLGCGWGKAHAAGLFFEPRGLCGGDEMTSEHGRFREGRTRECAERSPPRRFLRLRASRAGVGVCRGVSVRSARRGTCVTRKRGALPRPTRRRSAEPGALQTRPAEDTSEASRICARLSLRNAPFPARTNRRSSSRSSTVSVMRYRTFMVVSFGPSIMRPHGCRSIPQHLGSLTRRASTWPSSTTTAW